MAESKRLLFLVDDEPIQNEMLKDYLSEKFLYEIVTFSSGEEALKNMDRNPDMVVLDYHLGGNGMAMDGIEILKAIKDKYPAVQVIMLSGQDKINVAVDSIKYGAYDYVVKGETAFHRMENVISNLSELHKAQTINKAFKRTITILGVALVIIICISLWLVTHLH